jgi:glycosyltransferase involved in cell wall biosynthesis
LSEFGDISKIKVLYLSTYLKDYTRTETLLEILDALEVNLTTRFFDKPFKYFRALWYVLNNAGGFDVILVAFRGHEILPFIRCLTRKPIIFDSFVSVYDTICCDRELVSKKSLFARLLKCYDRFLCKISRIVLVDTKTHKEFFESAFNVSNIEYIYVGANKSLFKKLDVRRNLDEFRVFWYGKSNPLQGVDVILKAAKLLENNKNIKFIMVGPVRKKFPHLYREYKLDNIEYVDFVPYQELAAEINKADLCLGGHFSNKEKALRVIAGKTFQFLCCQKPTIVADNPANRELFEEKKLVHFVKPNDPQNLAGKILELSRK